MTVSTTMSRTMSATENVPAPTAPAPTGRPQHRGRPRSKELDASILTATLELASEVGINGMSMDELAQRAGVSKASIYRRWPSKELLVIDALRSAMGPSRRRRHRRHRRRPARHSRRPGGTILLEGADERCAPAPDRGRHPRPRVARRTRGVHPTPPRADPRESRACGRPRSGLAGRSTSTRWSTRCSVRSSTGAC